MSNIIPAPGWSSLPEDILFMIFDFAKHDIQLKTATESYPHTESFLLQYFTVWAPLLFVCRHWNEVASKMALLWNKIGVADSAVDQHGQLIVRPEQYFQYFLVSVLRSSTAPLQLYFAGSTLLRRALPVIEQHAFRIKVLVMAASDEADRQEVIHKLFELSFPAIQRVELYRSPQAELQNLHPDLPPMELSCERYPSLRTLHIAHTNLTSTTAFRTLRVLNLRWCAFADGPALSAAAFLHCIAAAPELEILDLTRTLHRLQDDVRKDIPLASLPRLHSLREVSLTDAPEVIAAFLSCFVFREDLSLKIDLDMHTRDELETREELVDAFKSAFPENRDAHLPVFRTLARGELEEFDGHITLVAHGPVDPTRAAPLGSVRMTLNTDADLAEDYCAELYADDFLETFAAAFARAPLRHLVLNGEFYWDGDEELARTAPLLDVLRGFPDVVALEVRGVGSPLPLLLMLRELDPQEDGSYAPMVCPKLAVLCVEMSCDRESDAVHGLCHVLYNRVVHARRPKMASVVFKLKRDEGDDAVVQECEVIGNKRQLEVMHAEFVEHLEWEVV